MSHLDISICVVLYRSEEMSRKFHRELLASLAPHEGWQLSYYDNSPANELKELAGAGNADPRISYLHDPRNLGFSYANNQLILTARHSRILLLNPDVFGFSPAHWDLMTTLETTDCVRFARLLNSDGSFQDCVGHTSSLRRAFSRVPDYSRVQQPTPVGMGIMAFMLADKAIYAEVGLLDCDYSLYAEDMDWCYRATKAGKPIYFDPRIELTHIGGASSNERWKRRDAVLRKYAAEIVFIDKHFRHIPWGLMRALNVVKRLRVRLQS